MNLLRVLILLALGLIVRRLWLTVRGERRARKEAARLRRQQREGRPQPYGDLTDQGIDDADYEEIP